MLIFNYHKVQKSVAGESLTVNIDSNMNPTYVLI